MCESLKSKLEDCERKLLDGVYFVSAYVVELMRPTSLCRVLNHKAY